MLKWTPKAGDDLELILDHISKNFDVNLAMKTVEGLIHFVENTLTANPLAGHILESNPLFSKLVYEETSVFYCENPKDKKIYIVCVLPRGTNFLSKRLTANEVA